MPAREISTIRGSFWIAFVGKDDSRVARRQIGNKQQNRSLVDFAAGIHQRRIRLAPAWRHAGAKLAPAAPRLGIVTDFLHVPRKDTSSLTSRDRKGALGLLPLPLPYGRAS
jgi:hypothetical protein